MFDTYFNFSLLKNTKNFSSDILESSLYKFKTPKKVYHVIVEKYNFNVFVVKYYISDYERSKNKYNIVFKEKNVSPSKIFRTVFEIMVTILSKNENCNFGFIGAEKIIGNKIEGKENTQRFKIYKYLCNNLIGESVFTHYESEKQSAYLLLNNKNQTDKLLVQAKNMFEKLYPSLVD